MSLINDLLSKTTVDSFGGPGAAPAQFRFVRKDQDLAEALLFLEVSKAHSLPFLNESGSVAGSFGYADLVNYIVGHLPEPVETVGSWKDIRREQFKGLTVANVIQGGAVEGTAVCAPTDSLLDACRLMVEKRAHRVFVVEGTALVNVVSQSMIAQFLLDAREQLDTHQLHQHIDSFELGQPRAIYSVNGSSTLLEAFQYMVGERVTGVAIMKGDHIVGSVSVSDVHVVLEKGGIMLLDTCDKVVEAARALHQAPEHVVTVSHKHSLLNTIELFVHQHISRLWLVEENDKPSRVITLTDLIRAVVSQGWIDPSQYWS